MNQQLVSVVAFFGGVFLAIQAGFNAHLGVLLKKPLLATIATSFSSLLFASVFVLMFFNEMPNPNLLKKVPWYLWFTGGLFSVIGISFYFYSIPKLGLSKMISLGLCGQLIFSAFATHFGWLNLPVEPITLKKIIGIMAMITGILLINSK
nr:DMT family transporter [Pedobacter panaciterrae]